MTDQQPNEEKDAFSPPELEDGFHAQSKDMKKRNLITAGLIVAFLIFWILLGLRDVIF